MRFFEASIETVILRFYLIMAIVIVSFFSGLYLFALLVVPLLIGTMLGVSFKSEERNSLGAESILDMETKTINAYKSAA